MSSAAMLYLYSVQILPYSAYWLFAGSPRPPPPTLPMCVFFCCLFCFSSHWPFCWNVRSPILRIVVLTGSFGLFLGVLDVTPLSSFLQYVVMLLSVECILCVFVFIVKRSYRRNITQYLHTYSNCEGLQVKRTSLSWAWPYKTTVDRKVSPLRSSKVFKLFIEIEILITRFSLIGLLRCWN